MRILRVPYDVELPPLPDGEEIVLDSVASHLRGWGTQGRLVLTNRRLVYLPWRLRVLPQSVGQGKLDIPIRGILSVQRRPWMRGLWGGFPGFPVFTIRAEDGTEYTFQTAWAGGWCREIGARITDDTRITGCGSGPTAHKR